MRVGAISCRRNVLRRAEERVEPLASIRWIAMEEPVPAQGTSDPHGAIHCVRVPRRDRPSECLSDVVLVSFQPTNSVGLRGSLQGRRRRLSEGREVARMANANVVCIAARVEEVERYLACGLKHP